MKKINDNQEVRAGLEVSTALVKVEPVVAYAGDVEPSAVSGVSIFDKMDAEQENAFKPQPVRISIDHKNQKFLVQDEVKNEFEAVVLWSDGQRALWLPNVGKWTAFNFVLPVCKSITTTTHEGRRVRGTVDGIPLDLDTFKSIDGNEQIAAELEPVIAAINDSGATCKQCPFAQWGSSLEGAKSKGQACKETRTLLLWWYPLEVPLTLRLPVTSVKQWDYYSTYLRMNNIKRNTLFTKFVLEKQQRGSQVWSEVRFIKHDPLSEAYKEFLSQSVNGGTLTLYEKLVNEFMQLDIYKSDTESEETPF